MTTLYKLKVWKTIYVIFPKINKSYHEIYWFQNTRNFFRMIHKHPPHLTVTVKSSFALSHGQKSNTRPKIRNLLKLQSLFESGCFYVFKSEKYSQNNCDDAAHLQKEINDT